MPDVTLSQTLELGKEYAPAGEDVAIAKLRDLHLKVQHVTPGPNRRGEHPKQHAGVWATFEVSAGIPAEFRIGLFEKPGSYTTFVRFSNGRSADDRLPDAHGFGVKVLVPRNGEAGPPLQQDFLMADHPVFFAQNVQHAFDFLAATASGTPVAQLAASTHPKLIGFTSKAECSPLNMTYWSQTPYKLGAGAVKYYAEPFADSLAIPIEDSADCLRTALTEQLTLRKVASRFNFYVIPQVDPFTMPVEDPTIEWTSTPVQVGTLTIYPQNFDSPERQAFSENLTWSPWNSLPDHTPLGGINRARRGVYQDSQDLRHATNGVPPFAPSGRESF